MKKLIALIALFVCVSTQAATWVQVRAIDGDKSAVDTDSLVFTDYTFTTRSAWVKMMYSNGEYTIMRTFVHCPTRMIAHTETNTYQATGHLVVHEANRMPWNYTTPNSVAEVWSNIICTTPTRNR